MHVIEIPVQHVLELSCSAYRTISTYIKEFDADINDPNITDDELPNKIRILSSLGLPIWENKLPPKNLKIIDVDKELANDIKLFYRRLAFNAMSDDVMNAFDKNIFSLLNAEKMKSNDVGYFAYLPYKYKKEYSSNKLDKYTKICERAYLDTVGSTLFDLDSEIIDVYKSKNYNAYNVIAVINNMMCSWMSNRELKLGPAVIIEARVKEHSQHHTYGNAVTRLNYVRAAQ